MNQDFRAKLRNFFGKYPSLFYYTYGLKPICRQLSVTKQTQLVIEGFSRSANTFAVVAFEQVNPTINIAHHLHIPAQIVKAVKWQIPTLVLIRHPRDAVASNVLRNPRFTIPQTLRNYIYFYQFIHPYQNSYVVGKFENIIKDYSYVIRKLNDKFNTSFVEFTPDKTSREVIDKIIQNLDDNPLRYALPNQFKDNLKKDIIKDMKNKYSQLLMLAEETYYKFIDQD